MDYLIELCTEGRVAGIGMGTATASVRAVLGEPDDETVAREPHVLIYGAMELVFSAGALEMITLGFGRPFGDLPPPGEIARQWTDGPSGNVVAALGERGIDLAPQPHPDDDVLDYRTTTLRGDIVNVTFASGQLSGVACSRGERAAPRILFMPAPPGSRQGERT